MATLGELILELKLDDVKFGDQLEKNRQKAVAIGREIESNWQNQIDRIKPLKAEVNDKALTDLNRHLDLKAKHFTQVNNLFKARPLTPTVNARNLQRLGGQIGVLSAQVQQTQKQAQKPIAVAVDTTQVISAKQQLVDLNNQVNVTGKKAVKLQANVRQGIGQGVGQQRVNVVVKQKGESIASTATGIVVGQTAERILAPVIDAALEEGFIRVLNLTSSTLKQTLGGVQFLGVGKVLGKQIDQLNRKTQKEYAPGGGVAGRTKEVDKELGRQLDQRVEKLKGVAQGKSVDSVQQVRQVERQVERKTERQTEKAVKSNGFSQTIKNAALLPAKMITKPISDALGGFYYGIGSAYGSKIAGGAIGSFEKRSGRSLEDVGANIGAVGGNLSGIHALNILTGKLGKLGRIDQAIDPVLKKYGINLQKNPIEEGLGVAASATERVGSILDQSLDETVIQQDIEALTQSLGNLSKVMSQVSSEADKAAALQQVSESVNKLVTYPKEAVVERYKQSAKESAQRIDERLESEPTPIEDLAPDTKRIAFVSAGFSATQGKQSHKMAEALQPHLAPGVKVVPFENREFDVEKDAGTDGVGAWATDVLKKVSGTIDKGYNPSAVRMAAEAYQYKQANPDVGIDLIGHSAGGLIAREAQAILKEMGIDANVLSLGTPNVGAFQGVQENALTLMGQGDALRNAGDSSSAVIDTVGGHELPHYVNDPNVQQIIRQFSEGGVTPELFEEVSRLTGASPTGSATVAARKRQNQAIENVADKAFAALNQPVPSETKKKVQEGYKRAAEEIKAMVEEGRSDFVVEDAKAGFRTSEAPAGLKDSLSGKDLPKAPSALTQAEAEQITLFVGGFGGVKGMESEYLGSELAKNLDSHHVVAVESPEFDVQPAEGQSVAHPSFLKKAYDVITKQAAEEGDNTVARRIAERAYAYHRQNPDKPINIVGQSGGSMPARGAAQILKEMGVENVRVVSSAGPYFGASEQQGMTMVSSQDPFKKIAGRLMPNQVPVDSVAGHSKYYNAAEQGKIGAKERYEQVAAGEVEVKPNTQVKAALEAFFDRSIDEATALQRARQAASGEVGQSSYPDAQSTSAQAKPQQQARSQQVRTITEVLPLPNQSQMPGQSLQPYPDLVELLKANGQLQNITRSVQAQRKQPLLLEAAQSVLPQSAVATPASEMIVDVPAQVLERSIVGDPRQAMLKMLPAQASASPFEFEDLPASALSFASENSDAIIQELLQSHQAAQTAIVAAEHSLDQQIEQYLRKTQAIQKMLSVAAESQPSKTAKSPQVLSQTFNPQPTAPQRQAIENEKKSIEVATNPPPFEPVNPFTVSLDAPLTEPPTAKASPVRRPQVFNPFSLPDEPLTEPELAQTANPFVISGEPLTEPPVSKTPSIATTAAQQATAIAQQNHSSGRKLFASSYENLIRGTAKTAGIENVRMPRISTQEMKQAGAYSFTTNEIILPPEKLKYIKETLDQEIQALTTKQLDEAVRNYSTIAHEAFHVVQSGFSGLSSTELAQRGAYIASPTPNEEETRQFQRLKGKTIHDFARSSTQMAAKTPAYQNLPKDQLPQVLKSVQDIETGAYNFQAKFMAKMLEEANSGAKTVAEAFDNAVQSLVAEMEATAQQIKAETATQVSEQVAQAPEGDVHTKEREQLKSQLDGFTVEILKEIHRLTTGKSTKAKKAEIVDNLLHSKPQELDQAIAAVTPLIEQGPKGGQKLKKIEQTPQEKKLVEQARKVEKSLNERLQKLKTLEGKERDTELGKLLSQISEQVSALDRMGGTQMSADGRLVIGRAKGRLETVYRRLSPKLREKQSQQVQQTVVQGQLGQQGRAQALGSGDDIYLARVAPTQVVREAKFQAEKVAAKAQLTYESIVRSVGEAFWKKLKPQPATPYQVNIDTAVDAAKVARRAQRTYESIVRSVAQASEKQLQPQNLPKLVVNDRLLAQTGTEALYDVKQNQIIISKQIHDILNAGPEALEQYTEKLQAVVHEARHAMQLDFGKLNLSQIKSGEDLAVGEYYGVEAAPDRIKKQAAASVRVATQQGKLTKQQKRAVFAAEVDAYSFEEETPAILKNAAEDAQQRKGLGGWVRGIAENFAAKREQIGGQLKQLDVATGAIASVPKLANDGVDALESLMTKFWEFAAQQAKGLPGGDVLSLLLEDMGAATQVIKPLLVTFIGFQVLSKVAGWFGQVAGAATTAAMEFQRFEQSLTFTSSASKAQSTLRAIRDDAKRLGVDLKQAVAGQAQLQAAAQGTSLEGAATDQFGGALRQASAVYGLDPESQQRVFLASSQIISKGKLSAEEIRQQMGEVLPGAFQIAARSMGVTTAELDKMLQRGEVLAEDFIPKFASQLSAETSSGVAGAANNAQAALNRFNNSVYEMQVALGKPLLPVKAFGMDVLNGLMQFVQNNAKGLVIAFQAIAVMIGGVVLKSLGQLIAKFLAVKLGIVTIGGALRLLQSQLTIAAKNFLVITAITDAYTLLTNATRDGGGAVRDFANQSQQGLENYLKLVGKAQEKTKSWSDSLKDIKTPSLMEDTLAGGALKLVLGQEAGQGASRVIERSFQGEGMLSALAYGSPIGWAAMAANASRGGGFRLATHAEKQANDLSIATSDALTTNNNTVNEVKSMIGVDGKVVAGSEIDKMLQVQQQIQAIQARRRGLLPGDMTTRRSLDDDEAALLKEMETASQPVSVLKSNLAGQLEGLKNTKQEITDRINQLESSPNLTQAEQESLQRLKGDLANTNFAIKDTQNWMDKLNTATSGSIDAVGRLARAFADVQGELERVNMQLDRSAAVTRKNIALQQQFGGLDRNTSLSREQAGYLRSLAEQENLTARIASNQQRIQEFQNVLGNVEIKKALESVDIQSIEAINPTVLRARIDGMDDTDQKKLLSRAADETERINQMQTETANMEAQLEESKADLIQQLRELNRSIDEYFREVTRSAEEMARSTKQMQLDTSITKAKTELQRGLNRFSDNFFGELVDQILNVVDLLNEPLRNALNAQQQIAQLRYGLEDRERQGQALARQVPGMAGSGGTSTGGGTGGAIASGLYTGPSANIGGSAEYHIDSKFSRSLGWEKITDLFDQMAQAYQAQGRVIEFSNRAVAGQRYDLAMSREERMALLRDAIGAHHSQERDATNGVYSVDYYVPKAGEDRHGSSVEGAEIMLPTVAGAKLEYGSGGGYGNYVYMLDAQGNTIMATGHGDDRRTLPQNRTLSAAPSQPAAQSTPMTTGTGGRSIRTTRSGQTDEYGNEFLNVELVENGQVVDRVQAVSGRPGRQNFRTAAQSREGSHEPLPEGTYSLGTPEFDANSFGNEALGGMWIGIDPNQSTERTALGIHVDGDRTAKPGTEGCLGFIRIEDGRKVSDWIEGGANQMVVDYGLGTVDGGSKPQPQALPQSAQTTASPSSPGQLDLQNLQPTDTVSREQSLQLLTAEALRQGITDPNQIAYILATAQHETDNFNTLTEYSSGDQYEGRSDLGNTQAGDGRRFKGRGFVQLTGRTNYEKYSDLLGIDLLSNPELVRDPRVAAFITVHGMKNGTFTGAGLDDYIQSGNPDFYNARRIVNGTDRADHIADIAQQYRPQVSGLMQGAQAGPSIGSVDGGGAIGGMINQTNSAAIAQINQGAAMSRQAVDAQIAAIRQQTAAQDAQARMQVEQVLGQIDRTVQQTERELQDNTRTEQRRQQDQELDAQVQTPQVQYQRQRLGIERGYEDATRQLSLNIERFDNSRTDLTKLRENLAGMNDPRLQPTIEAIDKALATMEAERSKNAEMLKKETEVRDKRLKYLDEQFQREEESRKIAAEQLLNDSQGARSQAATQQSQLEIDALRGQAEGLRGQAEAVRGQAESARRRGDGLGGFDLEAQGIGLQQQAIQSDAAAVEQERQMRLAAVEARRSQIEMDFRSKLHSAQEQLTQGAIDQESFDQYKQTLEETRDISLESLNQDMANIGTTADRNLGALQGQREELERQNEELAYRREQLQFDSRSQLFDSQVNVANAVAQGYGIQGLGAQSRDIEKQVRTAQANMDLERQIRQIDDAVRSGRLLADTAAQMKTNLRSLNEIQLDNIEKEFNLLTPTLEAVQGASENFFSGLLDGSKSLGEAFQGLVQDLLGSLSKLASQFIVDELFGWLMGKPRQQVPQMFGAQGAAGSPLQSGVGLAASLMGGGQALAPNLLPQVQAGQMPDAAALLSGVGGSIAPGDLFAPQNNIVPFKPKQDGKDGELEPNAPKSLDMPSVEPQPKAMPSMPTDKGAEKLARSGEVVGLGKPVKLDAGSLGMANKAVLTKFFDAPTIGKQAIDPLPPGLSQDKLSKVLGKVLPSEPEDGLGLAGLAKVGDKSNWRSLLEKLPKDADSGLSSSLLSSSPLAMPYLGAEQFGLSAGTPVNLRPQGMSDVAIAGEAMMPLTGEGFTFGAGTAVNFYAQGAVNFICEQGMGATNPEGISNSLGEGLEGGMDAKAVLKSLDGSMATSGFGSGIQAVLGAGTTPVAQSGFGGAIASLFGGMGAVPAAAPGFGSGVMSLLGGMGAVPAASGLGGGIASLFGSLFGGAGGGIFSLLGGLLGGGGLLNFSDGGSVPTVPNHKAYAKGDGAIAEALKREGHNAVLAALTPGERVLTVAQAKRYDELNVDQVLNFKRGGVVPGAAIATPKMQAGGGVNVNAPVTVNTSNADSVDVPAFQRVIDARIQESILRESRPGGTLNRR